MCLVYTIKAVSTLYFEFGNDLLSANTIFALGPLYRPILCKINTKRVQYKSVQFRLLQKNHKKSPGRFVGLLIYFDCLLVKPSKEAIFEIFFLL